jgi:hypothetical protein
MTDERDSGPLRSLIGRFVDDQRPWVRVADVRRFGRRYLFTLQMEDSSVPHRLDIEWLDLPVDWRIREGWTPEDYLDGLRAFLNREEEEAAAAETPPPPPPEDEPCGGWIGPDGRHWRYPDLAHQAGAAEIVKRLRLPVHREDPAYYLERHGWIHLLDCGLVMWGSETEWCMTQPQLDRLFDLALKHESMREDIMRALRRQRVLSERM